VRKQIPDGADALGVAPPDGLHVEGDRVGLDSGDGQDAREDLSPRRWFWCR
jgi:hypothetical protein